MTCFFYISFLLGNTVKRYLESTTLKRDLFFSNKEQFCLLKCHSLSYDYPGLIWDTTRSDWFNVYMNNKSAKESNFTHGNISLHFENIKALQSNKRQIYRELAYYYDIQISHFYMLLDDWINNFSKGRDVSRYALFNNAAVTKDGLVISKQTCKAAISGGCLSSTNIKSFSYNLPVYEYVISISAFWGDGI